MAYCTKHNKLIYTIISDCCDDIGDVLPCCLIVDDEDYCKYYHIEPLRAANA